MRLFAALAALCGVMSSLSLFAEQPSAVSSTSAATEPRPAYASWTPERARLFWVQKHQDATYFNLGGTFQYPKGVGPYITGIEFLRRFGEDAARTDSSFANFVPAFSYPVVKDGEVSRMFAAADFLTKTLSDMPEGKEFEPLRIKIVADIDCFLRLRESEEVKEEIVLRSLKSNERAIHLGAIFEIARSAFYMNRTGRYDFAFWLEDFGKWGATSSKNPTTQRTVNTRATAAALATLVARGLAGETLAREVEAIRSAAKIEAGVFFRFVAEINAATAGKLAAVLALLSTPSPAPVPASAPALPPAPTPAPAKTATATTAGDKAVTSPPIATSTQMQATVGDEDWVVVDGQQQE